MERITSTDLSHDSAQIQVTGFRRGTQDTKDYGRVVLGGGYAGVSAPGRPPIAGRN